MNAAHDPRFLLAMREARKLAQRDKRVRHAAFLATARAEIAEAGLKDSPLGERTARRSAQVESEIDQLSRIVDRVGRVRRDGSLSPAYERLLALLREDRAELRALVDRLVELADTQMQARLDALEARFNAAWAAE